MKTYKYFLLFFLVSGFLDPSQKGYAQQPLRWYMTAGVGASDVRDFGFSFKDLQYTIKEGDAMLDYGLHSKIDYLFNLGLGISGSFGDSDLVGWDVGVNVRSAGFRLTPELYYQEGQLSDFFTQMLPDFGKTESFRYWAVHIPASINYLPFKYIGFSAGLDLYYQMTSNITDSEFPYGRLGETMGVSFYVPDYKYPFQLGAHLGVYAPINENLRVDMEFFTDVTPRVKMDSQKGYHDNLREMGMRLNARYYFK